MPNIKPVPPKGTPTKITVQEGESLGVLAQRYNTSVNSIMKANGLKNDNIRSGQTLMVYVVSDEEMKYYNDLKKEYEQQQLEEQHKIEVEKRTAQAEALIQKAINDGYSKFYSFSINGEGYIVATLKYDKQLGDISKDFNLNKGTLLRNNPSIQTKYKKGTGIRRSDGLEYETWDASPAIKGDSFVIDNDECKTRKSLLQGLKEKFKLAREAAKDGRLW